MHRRLHAFATFLQLVYVLLFELGILHQSIWCSLLVLVLGRSFVMLVLLSNFPF
jgi:hypothetical protein